MNIALTKQPITPAEYLAVEEVAEHRSEYYDGEVYAMAGSSPAHSRICLNVGSEFRARLRGSTCQPFDSGLHVHVPATQLYTYPDASIVCGPLQHLPGSRTIVMNPSLIVEVLSPSTERYDRAAKFFHYQSIKTLRDYVLIAQDAARVEHFFLQTNDEQSSQWLYTAYRGVDAVLRLPSLKIEIPLREIYEEVKFLPGSEESWTEETFHPGNPPF